jgi:hypothetical protein
MKAAAAAPRWSPAAPPWPWSGWPRSRRPHRSSSPGGSGRLRPWTASCAGSVVHARIGAFVVRVAVGPSRRPFPSTGEVLDAHQRMLGGPEPDAAHVVEVAPPVEPERERHASGQGRPAVHHQPSMPSISANAGMRRLPTTHRKPRASLPRWPLAKSGRLSASRSGRPASQWAHRFPIIVYAN